MQTENQTGLIPVSSTISTTKLELISIKRIKLPLIGQSYIFTGDDVNEHKNGETFYVVETGQHWYKEVGLGIWLSNDDQERDVDYCWAVSPGYFNSNFWKS